MHQTNQTLLLLLINHYPPSMLLIHLHHLIPTFFFILAWFICIQTLQIKSRAMKSNMEDMLILSGDILTLWELFPPSICIFQLGNRLRRTSMMQSLITRKKIRPLKYPYIFFPLLFTTFKLLGSSILLQVNILIKDRTLKGKSYFNS